MASTHSQPSEPEDQNVEYVPIRVTTGILLHIGAGIYHSVAGALKELVNNSFDADATQVLISTDYPKFQEIVVIDNGSGMSADRFRQAMSIIGSSLKALVDKRRSTPIYRRPIIGRLGIGFMALSQICGKAIIESQEENSTTKFVAVLDFSQFKKRESEQIDESAVQVLRDQYGTQEELEERLRDRTTSKLEKAELKTIKDVLAQAEKQKGNDENLQTEHLGYCVLRRNLPAVGGKKGTTITLQEIDDSVRDILKDEGKSTSLLPQTRATEINWQTHQAEVNKWSWKELCRRLRDEKNGLTYQALPNYHQFLWELSLMTPIPYLDRAPVTLRPSLLSAKKRALERYKFSLAVDNRILRKPILLPSGSLSRAREPLRVKYDFNVETFSSNKIVDGRRLQYQGYLYWQRNQVKPTALRGLEIYIRNVGIGTYDYTLLGFPTVNLTSRAGQVSGEVFVDHGLEMALNIDRNSFKETHEHYVALQHHIWDLLGSLHRGHGLFGQSIDSYELRKADKDAEKETVHVRYLKDIVGRASDNKLSLSFHRTAKENAFEVKDGRLIVYDGSSRWPKARQERFLCQRFLLTAVAAIKSGASRRDLLELLQELILKR
jgi:hypothetical protein